MQASCNDDLSVLEKKHVQVIQDLQQQHEQEVAALLMERDRQLQKETAATLAGKKYSHKPQKLILFKSLYDFWSHLSHRCDEEISQPGAGEESTHPGWCWRHTTE